MVSVATKMLRRGIAAKRAHKAKRIVGESYDPLKCDGGIVMYGKSAGLMESVGPVDVVVNGDRGSSTVPTV